MKAKKSGHVTILTGGKKIPGMAFMGETMVCGLCGAVKQSDPTRESNWTLLAAGAVKVYYCNKEQLDEYCADFVQRVKQQGQTPTGHGIGGITLKKTEAGA